MTEAVDVTEINRRLHLLEEQVHRQEELDRELADENRNIEAYVTSLKETDNPERRDALAEAIQEEALRDISRMRGNLERAGEESPGAERALEENLEIAGESIGKIRKAVSELKKP